ncbi:NAD(P)-binding protein [Paraburkholderia youngii]|uniref:NAD(P)-binding protein n=1 Tax=Paraburkholderia youngii TaxID=2782701 RepID=UPI00158FE205|nr:NAD(P)-binding protein [Paraburkholderia youngii]NUX56146.1 NAD(P)-binding protein [Paraburkholderia youngii]
MMDRPDYIYTNGSPLQHTPMHLNGAEMYGFLIKGNKTKLQATVDATLNQVAGNQTTFRVLSPYVMLTFTRVNHAQSGFSTDHDRGWGKECDIIPWIMVGQIDESGGAAKLHRLFIFPSYTWVDVPMAISIGREIFGYPKNFCKLEMPEAGDDPVEFKIACEGWEPSNPETQLGIQPLLEIAATNREHEHVSVSGLAEIVVGGLKLLGSEPDPLSLDMVGIEDLASMLLEPQIDQLFLKQFPDASGTKAVYQEVVVAPTTIDKVHSASLLGYTYECTLHKFDSYRLDETLGFQLGTQPVLLPFHISMDFTVEAGEELARATAIAPEKIVAAKTNEEMLRAPATDREKIVVLGGGPGAMAAAFYLTDQPGWRDRYDITVYQMGWRLGGKCASGRNAKLGQRIEEHGLHMWFGFYNNGFDLMQKAYGALNRPAGTPLATWQDAFKPHNFIVLTEPIGNGYRFWPIQMPQKDGTPGGHNDELTFIEIAETLAAWIRQWVEGLKKHLLQLVDKEIKEGVDRLEGIWHGILGFATRMRESFHLLVDGGRHPVVAELQALRASVFESVDQYLDDDDAMRHFYICIDLAITTLIGMHVDGIMFKSFDVVNDIEFRAWLCKHGANVRYTVNSAPVRGLYDLVFAYIDGDSARPNIEAGTMLRGMLRLAIDYHGGFIWKMQAGMGDTVFTPLYQVLKQRGVNFQFFHKVEDLIPESDSDSDSDSVSEIVITQQVALKEDVTEYNPLVEVAGLDCWPSFPDYQQVDPQQAQLLSGNDLDLESHWNVWARIYSAEFGHPLPVKRLVRGVDFDKIVFGLPIGSWRYVCPKLIERSAALKAACDNVKTVATQAYQIWLNEDLRGLGWEVFGSDGEEPILSSFSDPFDTSTPMNQLLLREAWPAGHEPKNIAYFCSPIRTPNFSAAAETAFPADCAKKVKDDAVTQLKTRVFNLWPTVADRNEFNWEILIDPHGEIGEKRFDAQYWRANVSPSDLYVLSVVGSTEHRIASGESGFSNLYLAGDWLKTGLNAGCVEGAVMGGMQASRAICGYPSIIRGETDR